MWSPHEPQEGHQLKWQHPSCKREALAQMACPVARLAQAEQLQYCVLAVQRMVHALQRGIAALAGAAVLAD